MLFVRFLAQDRALSDGESGVGGSQEVGPIWPVADDVTLETMSLDGVAAESSIVPGSERARVLLFFHGGGYCSGSILSHRAWRPRQVARLACEPLRSSIASRPSTRSPPHSASSRR
jgi:acetyl esterase/lipase